MEGWSSAPIAVIGGGIVGLCCARALAARGESVVVIDPGALERAAPYRNAGHLAVGEVVPLPGPDVCGPCSSG